MRKAVEDYLAKGRADVAAKTIIKDRGTASCAGSALTCSGNCTAWPRPRRRAPPAVVELLITAAELHIRADLGVVDAAEKNHEPELAGTKRNSPKARRTGPAAADPAAADAAAAGTTGSAPRAKSAAS